MNKIDGYIDSGILIVKNVKKRDVSRQAIYDYIKINHMEKIGPGMYITQETLEDESYTLSLRCPRGIISHDDALYTVKKDLLDLGKTTVINNFGHTVPMYDLERTICDLVRSRSNFEIQDFNSVLKTYVSKKDKDLNKLMEYAKAFRIDKIVRQYMEVLL